MNDATSPGVKTGPPQARGPRPDRRASCLVAVNLHSRNGREQRDAVLAALAAEGFATVTPGTCSPNELAGLIDAHRHRLDPATDRIFVGGGDGTVNRLLPDLVDAPVPVALVPLGTANDLARNLGLPDGIDAAVRTARTGRPCAIDLGRINDRLFANVASLGLGPTVTRRLSTEMKRRLGVLSYPGALLGAYREVRPFRCWISEGDDGPERHVRAIHVAIGSGRFYGGGVVVDERAAIDDHCLSLYALSPLPLWYLVLLLPWLRGGRHRQLGRVTTLRQPRISLRTSRPLPISADGEIVSRTPARFDVLPAALTVMVPMEPGEGMAREIAAEGGPRPAT